jgi:hypothetical protein
VQCSVIVLIHQLPRMATGAKSTVPRKAHLRLAYSPSPFHGVRSAACIASAAGRTEFVGGPSVQDETERTQLYRVMADFLSEDE